LNLNLVLYSYINYSLLYLVLVYPPALAFPVIELEFWLGDDGRLAGALEGLTCPLLLGPILDEAERIFTFFCASYSFW